MGPRVMLARSRASFKSRKERWEPITAAAVRRRPSSSFKSRKERWEPHERRQPLSAHHPFQIPEGTLGTRQGACATSSSRRCFKSRKERWEPRAPRRTARLLAEFQIPEGTLGTAGAFSYPALVPSFKSRKERWEQEYLSMLNSSLSDLFQIPEGTLGTRPRSCLPPGQRVSNPGRNVGNSQDSQKGARDLRFKSRKERWERLLPDALRRGLELVSNPGRNVGNPTDPVFGFRDLVGSKSRKERWEPWITGQNQRPTTRRFKSRKERWERVTWRSPFASTSARFKSRKERWELDELACGHRMNPRFKSRKERWELASVTDLWLDYGVSNPGRNVGNPW